MKANVGMIYPVAAPITAYTPGTGVTYGTGFVVAEARTANLSWERSDGEFYGDDELLDTDNGVTGGTLDFEPTGLANGVRASLLGEVVGTNTDADTYFITDAAAPDVGFGYVRVMRDNTVNTSGVSVVYEGWWFYKAKFSLNGEETATKERNVEWRTPTLNGRLSGVSLDATGALTFAKHKDFATLAAAKAWLKGLANIT